MHGVYMCTNHPDLICLLFVPSLYSTSYFEFTCFIDSLEISVELCALVTRPFKIGENGLED